MISDPDGRCRGEDRRVMLVGDRSRGSRRVCSDLKCGIQVAETKHSYKVVACSYGLSIPHAPSFLREGPCLKDK
jgi:hypothetical protein